MSTPERTRACCVTIDREIADALRLHAKNVMVFGHELFEDMLEFCPEAQQALAMRYCDATAVVNVVGWDPDRVDPNVETFEVSLTDDLIEQLRHRRWDLAVTNKDRLDGLDVNDPIDPELLAEITVDRLAAQALDRLFGKYAAARSA